jgi:predicted nucleic acid-binding protein
VLRWLNRFPDQRFSLIDAVSFEVMRRERLTSAFAFDRQFEVEGFELLA